MGAQAIKEATRLLESVLRRSDLIGFQYVGSGRLGGDEFAMLLTSITPVRGEHQALGRLRANMDKGNRLPERKYRGAHTELAAPPPPFA